VRFVLAVAVASVLAACDPASASRSSAVPASLSPAPAAPSTSRAPGAAVTVDRYSWRQASIAIDANTFITDVADTPFGWAAVGVRLNIPDATHTFPPNADPFANLYSGVLWTSRDGLSWVRHPDAATFGGARFTKIVGTQEGALIVGLAGICLPDACSGLPPNGGTIVWSSTDGETWDRVPDTGLAEAAVIDVKRVDGGFVAAGYVKDTVKKPAGDSFNHPTDAAIWRSTDGRHWTRVGEVSAADRIFELSTTGPFVVAVGRRSQSTVSWRSTDAGATWTEGRELGDDCCSVPRVLNGRVVVAQFDVDRSDATVSTTDMTTSGSWTTTRPAAMRGYRPESAAVIGASIVTFGWTVKTGADALLEDDQPRAFASSDGLSWATATFPAPWNRNAPTSVAQRGNQVVVVLGPLDSLNGPPAALDTTVWLGTGPG
jgi:hypothetical protein